MKKITVDKQKRIYVIERDGDTIELSYRSEESARVVAQILKSRFGWKVVTKKDRGLYPTDKEMMIVWVEILRGILRGNKPKPNQYRTQEKLLACGVILKVYGAFVLTKAGVDWLDKPRLRAFKCETMSQWAGNKGGESDAEKS